jgi:hypothetical protein
MYSFYLVAFFPLAALAAIDGHCSGAATGQWLQDGICEHTATCNYYKGKYMTGGCPNDPDDVKCCLVGLGPDTSGKQLAMIFITVSSYCIIIGKT